MDFYFGYFPDLKLATSNSDKELERVFCALNKKGSLPICPSHKIRCQVTRRETMKKMKKHVRTLPFVIVCLLVLSSAATFAQRKFMALRAARPEVKILLSGAVERDDARVPVEKASIVKSGEILDWTITSANEGNASAHDYKTVGEIPAG